jgi:hypothetical protein
MIHPLVKVQSLYNFFKLFYLHTMTNEQLQEIKRLNENFEWLKSQHNGLTISTEWVNMKEAMILISRKRTWIQNRLVKNIENHYDVDSVLVRDVDWIREGNRIMLKRDSLLRLKSGVMQSMGNQYDNISC